MILTVLASFWRLAYLFWHNFLRQVWRVAKIVQATKGCRGSWSRSRSWSCDTFPCTEYFWRGLSLPKPLIVVEQRVDHTDFYGDRDRINFVLETIDHVDDKDLFWMCEYVVAGASGIHGDHLQLLATYIRSYGREGRRQAGMLSKFLSTFTLKYIITRNSRNSSDFRLRGQ